MEYGDRERILGQKPLAQAPAACINCKQRKKKCDKALPKCSSCIKGHRHCDYPIRLYDDLAEVRIEAGNISLSTPTSQETVAAGADFDAGVRTYRNDSAFPPVFFLDHDMFRRSLGEVPRLESKMVSGIQNLVGDPPNVSQMASFYFQFTHPWVPFISKKLFYERLLSPLAQPQADHSILFACMKLTSTPMKGNNPRTQAYITVKTALFKAEIAGLLTFRVLQAWVLVALYELGHAIYPSAYTSIGTCARLGYTLGINESRVSIGSSTTDWHWIEDEERLRTWWAILILDRYVNLGYPARPLATENPDRYHPLPSDDDIWDQGLPQPSLVSTLSSPPSTTMGRFGLLAQAASLLGQVLRHNRETTIDRQFHDQEEAILDQALIALTRVSYEEASGRGVEICSPVTVCHSARMTLASNNPTDAGAQMGYDNSHKIPLATFIAAEDVLKLARYVLATKKEDCDEVSPYLLDSMYNAGITYAQMYQSSRSQPFLDAFQDIKNVLGFLNLRWTAAGEYVLLLKARETQLLK